MEYENFKGFKNNSEKLRRMSNKHKDILIGGMNPIEFMTGFINNPQLYIKKLSDDEFLDFISAPKFPELKKYNPKIARIINNEKKERGLK